MNAGGEAEGIEPLNGAAFELLNAKLSLRDGIGNIPYPKELMRYEASNIKINISLSAHYKSN
ncbi:MAG TPA: hypothetical protein PLS84_09245 [Salinivirgaceae bacterium]|nr:hypothetical protein [Salinivirgaceae bacterium]